MRDFLLFWRNRTDKLFSTITNLIHGNVQNQASLTQLNLINQYTALSKFNMPIVQLEVCNQIVAEPVLRSYIKGHKSDQAIEKVASCHQTFVLKL